MAASICNAVQKLEISDVQRLVPFSAVLTLSAEKGTESLDEVPVFRIYTPPDGSPPARYAPVPPDAATCLRVYFYGWHITKEEVWEFNEKIIRGRSSFGDPWLAFMAWLHDLTTYKRIIYVFGLPDGVEPSEILGI